MISGVNLAPPPTPLSYCPFLFFASSLDSFCCYPHPCRSSIALRMLVAFNGISLFLMLHNCHCLGQDVCICCHLVDCLVVMVLNGVHLCIIKLVCYLRFLNALVLMVAWCIWWNVSIGCHVVHHLVLLVAWSIRVILHDVDKTCIRQKCCL